MSINRLARPTDPSRPAAQPSTRPTNTLSQYSISANPAPRDAEGRYDLELGAGQVSPPPPLRPERSMRRPLNTPSPATLSFGGPAAEGRFPDMDGGSGRAGVGAGGRAVGAAGRNVGDRFSNVVVSSSEGNGGEGEKSRRMMDQLNAGPAARGGLGEPRRRRGSGSSASSTESAGRAISPTPPAGRPAAVAPPSQAVKSALAAFTMAGARGADRRNDSSPTPPPAPTVVKRRLTKGSLVTPYPDTPAFREVEAAVRKVRKEWPTLMLGTAGAGDVEGVDEFDPVTLALSLLDPATVGTNNSLPAFLRLKAEIEHAISATLSADKGSYRAFERSITTYNTALSSLGNSQKAVGEMKKGLGGVREKLEGKGRDGLAGMFNRMSHLEEMVKILDEIDTLRLIPDRLESLLSEKRFLSAVVLLVRSLKTINKPEMLEIGALSDLRSWLGLQEGVLLEILTEELHNHLYLKSFYCEARWKAYTRGQIDLPHVDFGDDTDVLSSSNPHFDPSSTPSAHASKQSKLHRYLNALSLRPSNNPLLDEPIDDVHADATAEDGSTDEGEKERKVHKNLEVDSFVYIETLLESLACLGKLGYALDSVTQRVQVEMFNLIEGTVEEVEERNDGAYVGGSQRPTASFTIAPGRSSLSGLSLAHTSVNRSALLRLTATETNDMEKNVETLRDLFWTLYSKLDAVLQGFRVSYEVSMRITDRRDFKDSSVVKNSSGNLLFSLMEIWKPVQQEVRALLHDYLADDQSGTVSSRNPIVSVNEVLRLARPRDHTKQIFKFADSDLKASAKALKYHEDDLNRALKSALPGLLSEFNPTSTAPSSQLIVTDDRYGGGRNGAGGSHKALVSADPFNVSILFGPTLAFMDRVKEVMPSGGMPGAVVLEDEGNGVGAFLDGFVLKTFLPQLEEKVTSVFHQAVGGHDAFQEDPNYKRVSPVPIVKSVSNLLLLISSLCSMLRATPFHRENYSHLIVSVIHQFYERCNERFKDLTARDQSVGPNSESKGRQKTSATWATISEIDECMTELRQTGVSEHARMAQALRRETKIELETKGNAPIRTDDLINSPKKILALATLYSSLDWFIQHIRELQITDPTTDSNIDDDVNFSLPLTPSMTAPFTALLSTYTSLLHHLLSTLRLEIRLATIHHLDKATREGVYLLLSEEEGKEPDKEVGKLNDFLTGVEELVRGALGGRERRFLFQGLSTLMNQQIVSNARLIRLANAYGIQKMMRNILALRQNWKNITVGSSGDGGGEGQDEGEEGFERSRKFYDIFARGPPDMLARIRSGDLEFDFDDFKSMLNLMCSIDQSSKDSAIDPGLGVPQSNGGGAVGEKGRRAYNEFLIELFTLDVE